MTEEQEKEWKERYPLLTIDPSDSYDMDVNYCYQCGEVDDTAQMEYLCESCFNKKQEEQTDGE